MPFSYQKLQLDILRYLQMDIPFIQHKRRIRRSISMSEVDRLSLVFVDFNIPVFTPGRHRVQPTLDLTTVYKTLNHWVQLLRLTLSKGPSFSFENIVFSSYLEYWMMDKVNKSSDSDYSEVVPISSKFHNLVPQDQSQSQGQSQSHIMTDSRPVSLGVRHPSGTATNFSPSLFV
jgi:hypothetical protein